MRPLKKTKTKLSMQDVYETDRKQQEIQGKIQKTNAWGGQLFSWLVSIIFALVPLLICRGEVFIYSDNPEMIAKIQTYRDSFFGSGSVLWIGITLLIMSMIDMILFGTKKNIWGKKRYQAVLLLALIFLIAGCGVFITNVTNPISLSKIEYISWIAFALFAIVSGIITFDMVQEY